MLARNHRPGQPQCRHPVRQIAGHDHAGGKRPLAGARAEKVDRGSPIKRDRGDTPRTQDQIVGVRERLGDQRTRGVRPVFERRQQYDRAFRAAPPGRNTTGVNRGDQRLARVVG